MIRRLGSIALAVVTALLLSTSIGCYNSSDAGDDASSDPPNVGEPLEGPAYEPPGMSQNPARPQTERPDPVPSP